MLKLISFIGYVVIHLINRSLRVREINPSPWKERKAVFAFWHGEQFIPCYRHRNQDVAIMSSLSRDGEIQSGILSRLGYVPVRGSSTRGGEKALVETIRLVKRGRSAAFAVDGPRGPYRRVKPGILSVARKTGRPVIPVSSASKRSTIFSKAWDRYELPLPFSRSVIAYGKPVEVQKDDDLEAKAREVEGALEELSGFLHGGYWSNDPAEYLRSHPCPKILIVQPSRIGDVLFSLPTAAALRKRFPNAWIGWFVDERCAPLLEGCADIDEVIVFDRGRVSLPYLLGLRRQLHERRLDLSIDLHGLFKSALMVALAGARFRIASSSTNGMRELSWLFSREIRPPEKETHCVDRHLAVARYLGAPDGKPEYHINVGDKERKKIEELLLVPGEASGRPLVAVHPGGGWLSRRWSPERYCALIGRVLSETDARVVLVGGKEGGAGEKGLNEKILSRVKGNGQRVADLTGLLSLKELAALLLKSTAFVANEAGPLHLAAALNVPSVALLGPTDPARTGPHGGNVRILRHTVDCQPCRERSCPRRTCMDLITVDEVFNAVKDRL
ncbi:MAG: lipopolysaccharide heptosyltransferase II [Endomicrobiales bacterium]